MLKVQDYSISKKLTWVNMLVSGVALLLACAAFFAYDSYSFRGAVVRNLSVEAQIIGSNSVSALVFGDPHSAETTLSALRTSSHVTYAAIYTQDGQPFAGYWRDGGGKSLPLPPNLTNKTQIHWFIPGHINLVQAIIFEGKPTGFVYIQSDLLAMNNRWKSYTLIATTVLLISLVVALLTSRRSQRVISQPVMQLAETVRIVSRDKDYSIRARRSGSHDEISVLIEAFNEMLAQIQNRDAALRNAHDELEVRVEERTRQLAAANKELALRNREVERATQMKSKFLASMSHELRTPLNAIVGFSDLLGEQAAGQLNDKQKRFIQHIRQGSNHLLQLINDILDLSKIEAGQLDVHCVSFQVGEALPEVLSTIRPLAMSKSINVQHSTESDLRVLADRVRFKQILYNLLSNAVKFTPKDGRIDIECRRTGEFVCISVTDTGIGIQPEDQAMVFEEFRQVEGSGSGAHEGTGLGLAITKRLVEQQGGSITLESEPGKGSRFTVILPPGSGTSVEEPPLIAAPGSAISIGKVGNKPLVLIVDDEPPARELLASYLDSRYRVAMAESGVEALQKAKHLRPDVITLDVLMANGNGFEALVGLRKDPETAKLPIVILSVVDQREVGFALGATDYLVKPILKPVLLETLRKYAPLRGDDDSAILLVDDDPRALELLEEAVRSAGYEAQSVQSGTRALEVLSSKLVGAVLLDLLMPGMDGFQVIRHIRREHALKELPIFVMTAKNLTSEEMAILRQETQSLLQKNGSWQQQLIEEIGRVLDGKPRAKGAWQG